MKVCAPCDCARLASFGSLRRMRRRGQQCFLAVGVKRRASFLLAHLVRPRWVSGFFAALQALGSRARRRWKGRLFAASSGSFSQRHFRLPHPAGIVIIASRLPFSPCLALPGAGVGCRAFRYGSPQVRQSGGWCRSWIHRRTETSFNGSFLVPCVVRPGLCYAPVLRSP